MRLNLKVLSILILPLAIVIAFTEGCRKKQPVVPPESSAMSPSGGDVQPAEPKSDRDGSEMDLDALSSQLKPVFFDYNKFDIRPDQVPTLQNNARVLKENPKSILTLEGHCDERGTEEYNLALGERRSNAVKEYLVRLGVEESRLKTVSYGETKPLALQHDEQSWQQNRRAQSVVLRLVSEK